MNNIFNKYKKNKYFIETGSYMGDGIEKAIEAGFENIISIEITPTYYELCKEKFKDYSNVEIILGDSVKVLPEILKDIKVPCTFWLDAHYVDKSTEYGDNFCSIMHELEIIKEHEITTHSILINDMRCWDESNFFYKHYLFNNDDIKNKIKEINPNYTFSFEDGYIENDVLVAETNIEIVKVVKEIKPVVEDIEEIKPIKKEVKSKNKSKKTTTKNVKNKRK